MSNSRLSKQGQVFSMQDDTFTTLSFGIMADPALDVL